jgi:hypothetical protein
MPNQTDERGLLIFLADWVRSPALRGWLNDPALSLSEVIDELRRRYLLDDDMLGVLLARERGDLLAKLVKVVFQAKLDVPDAWGGSQAAEGARGGGVPAASTTATNSVPGNGPPVGWGGAALVCLESALADGKRAGLKANAEMELQVLGWNLRSPAKLRFVDTNQVTVDVEMAVVSDGAGRSRGQVKVRLPKAGSWSIELVGQGNARSTLVDAIRVES